MRLKNKTYYDTVNKNLIIQYLGKSDDGGYKCEKVSWSLDEYKTWVHRLPTECKVKSDDLGILRNKIIGVSGYKGPTDHDFLRERKNNAY